MRFGFILFVVGLFFLILSLGLWQITSLMAENRLLPGVEAALPWHLCAAGAGLASMVLGLFVRR